MSDASVGKIRAIAIKTAESGPMREVEEAVAEVDGGLVGGVKPSPDRGITFLATAHWRQVMGELNANLPWHTRRANVLIEAESLAHLIGKRLRFGEVEVQVINETRPCGLMDQFLPGLKDALKPDCRAGVYGRVICGGVFRIGDTATASDAPAE